ncbi:carrier superfamily protein [Cardiosporidium cionae]|uniref:Carrier superfamily protein n=1 Tax=Cardiosporidium cionae TaxID=476202 RepID=A0ABQ7JAD7_9APIC|nr:carrier superfamily protein [Cardiosporidium cionae]|eukprot:KAF8820920.1 carrier superfamily protein [Cardiosporidium cionae]
MDPLHLFLSSSVSGVFVAFLCTPFDVVKNFWQFNASLSTRRTTISCWNVVSQIYSSNGLKGFWTGIWPAVGVVIPSNIIFFYLFESMKKQDRPFWAGVKARTIAVTAIAPLEYTRTKLQADIGIFYTDTSSGYKKLHMFLSSYIYFNDKIFMARNYYSLHAFDTVLPPTGNVNVRTLLRTVVQEEGFLSLWRGVFPTLVRDVPFSAIYWELTAWGNAFIERHDRSYQKRSNAAKNFLYPFLVGGMAAGIASIITHPFDVVKTNMQATNRITRKRGFVFVKREATLQIVHRIYRSEGLRGFTVGAAPRVAKLIPSCAILLGTFEFSRSFAGILN